MFAASWSAYEVFAIISGLSMMVCVVIPTLGWKDRLALGGAGFGLVIYGIYVANQDSGYFTFPVEIFLIPFIALGYAGWQSWVWAWQKWPGGLSDVAESINQLGSGSTSSGSQPTNVGRAPGGVTDPNLPAPPPVSQAGAPGSATPPTAAPTWNAGGGARGDEARLPAPPPASGPPAPPSVGPQPSQVTTGEGDAPWWAQNQADNGSPSP